MCDLYTLFLSTLNFFVAKSGLLLLSSTSVLPFQSLISTGFKTAATIYKNKKEAQQLESLAEKNHMAKMAAGEIEYKKAVMANTATAERLTGYLVGGISPFATKQLLTAVMDESLLNFDRVVINGGQRGLLLKMATIDIVKILNCKITKIARE